MLLSDTFSVVARWLCTWLLHFGPWHEYLAPFKDHDVVVAIQRKRTCHSSCTGSNDCDPKPRSVAWGVCWAYLQSLCNRAGQMYACTRYICPLLSLLRELVFLLAFRRVSKPRVARTTRRHFDHNMSFISLCNLHVSIISLLQSTLFRAVAGLACLPCARRHRHSDSLRQLLATPPQSSSSQH